MQNIKQRVVLTENKSKTSRTRDSDPPAPPRPDSSGLPESPAARTAAGLDSVSEAPLHPLCAASSLCAASTLLAPSQGSQLSSSGSTQEHHSQCLDEPWPLSK